MTICKKRTIKMVFAFSLFLIGFVLATKSFSCHFEKSSEGNYVYLIPNSSSNDKFDNNLLIITHPDSWDVREKNIYYYSTKNMCVEQKRVEISRANEYLEELFVQWRIYSNIPEDVILCSSSAEFGHESITEFENSNIKEFTSSYTITMDISHTISPFFESNELVLDSLIQTVKEAYDSEEIALTILVDGMVIYKTN